jgi:hypothetical protein
MTNPQGALFFWKDEPHVTGYIVIGNEHYELAGVRRSQIRTDLTGRKIITEQQVEMFDDGSGDGAG